MKSVGPAVTGTRIELDGRIVSSLEYRVTPRGTAVLRMTVDCSAAGEDLKLAVVMLGEPANALKASLAPGQTVKVCGRLRSIRAGANQLRIEEKFEVVADSIERANA
jgi:single-stranded DNA-binding protein